MIRIMYYTEKKNSDKYDLLDYINKKFNNKNMANSKLDNILNSNRPIESKNTILEFFTNYKILISIFNLNKLSNKQIYEIIRLFQK
jgi:hypothetical protein